MVGGPSAGPGVRVGLGVSGKLEMEVSGRKPGFGGGRGEHHPLDAPAEP